MTSQWQYLEQRPHPWRKQLYIKGKRLKAFTVWMDMLVNNLSPQEVAENKDIALEAVMEALEYCQNNSELLKAEAIEVRRRLEEKGYNLEPQVTHR